MFDNIVVPLDGSPCALRALEVALAIAKAQGSKLAVCSVADREDAQRYVNEGLSKAREANVVATGAIMLGDPVPQIVEYARTTGARAIVMGTHGRSGLGRLLMGSVAEGVLRSTSIPVITVREKDEIASPAAASAS